MLTTHHGTHLQLIRESLYTLSMYMRQTHLYVQIYNSPTILHYSHQMHQPGEHDQRHQLRHPQLGHPWDTPTRLTSNATPSSPDVSLASATLITSSNWQTKTTMGSDHLPIFISLQMAPSSTPSLHRNYVNIKKTNWERYSKDIEETRNICSLVVSILDSPAVDPRLNHDSGSAL